MLGNLHFLYADRESLLLPQHDTVPLHTVPQVYIAYNDCPTHREQLLYIVLCI